MQDKTAEFAIDAVEENNLIEIHAPAVELSEIALREEMVNISICTYNISN